MSAALRDRFGALVCDLDGVVYRGPVALPYAVEALAGGDQRVHYATNNASRLPSEVAAHLLELGLATVPQDVTTSAEAGASELARLVEPGSAALAIGGEGVGAALADQGLSVRRDASTPVAGVLQGYGREVRAADLAEAAYAVQGGACWVATNTDLTLPTDRGTAPGNGSLVGAVRLAVGRDPDLVAGKPHPPLYRLCLARIGSAAGEVLAVGDRLDTDIEGAVSVGLPSLLVLTGVSTLRDVLTAPPSRRPTWVAPDLRWLDRPVDDPVLQQLRALLDDGWARMDQGPVSQDWVDETVASLHILADPGATVD